MVAGGLDPLEERRAVPRGERMYGKDRRDHAYNAATLRSRSVQGIQQQTALAIRSFIAASERRRLKRKR